MSDLETLWETHDFALSKVSMLEDEHYFLVGQLHDYFTQETGVDIKDGNLSALLGDDSLTAPINNDKLRSQFEEVGRGLENYYNKQLSTIIELEDFYKENPYTIPPEREVSVESFKELKLVTSSLRDALKKSTEEIKILLTSAD